MSNRNIGAPAPLLLDLRINIHGLTLLELHTSLVFHMSRSTWMHYTGTLLDFIDEVRSVVT